MPYNSDVIEKVVSSFGGALLTLDPYGIAPEQAALARNTEFLAEGEIKTRYGHSAVFNPGDAITAMFNWLYVALGNLLNYLVYYTPGTGVRRSSVISPASSTIMTQTTAAGAAFATVGQPIYAAFYNANGQADSGGQVYSTAAGADPLFRRPPLTTEVTVSFTEGGANSGSIVAGLHRVGFYLTTANGYSTRLAPLNSSIVFVPQDFTASGNRNVTVTLTPIGGYTWPTGASVTLVMTTATNLAKYIALPLSAAPPTFVAGGVAANIQFDITDEDLNQGGTDVTLQETIISQDASGNPPFLPSFLFSYDQRMGYVGLDGAGIPVCFFSEPSQYQQLTAAQHGVYLPGNLPIVLGFSLRGVAYLIGPHWTYSTTDSGQVPAQWASPQLVDGSIGARGQYCVWLNASQGFAWVADTGGLYLFSGGQYPTRPVSYYQYSDWKRINWSVPHRVYVVDDKDNKRVSVYAPLDGATAPSHRLRWYYVDGVQPEQVKYSIDDIGGGYQIGAATLVESLTKGLEEWIGPAVADNVLRVNNGSETNPYLDVAAPINHQYQLGLLPGQNAQKGTIQFHHAVQLRVRGGGTLGLSVSSLDGGKTVVPAKSPLALSANPGLEPIVRFSMMSEQCNLTLTNANAANSWFWLSLLRWFYTIGPPQR